MKPESHLLATQSSRLISCLHELGVTGVELSPKNLTDKLGQLIDLSDSIALSEALRALPKTALAAKKEEDVGPRDEFLAARVAIVKYILSSFELGISSAPHYLPKPTLDTLTDEASGYQPYQKFYSLHQSEMDFRLMKLRLNIRQGIACYSRSLAQLAALDAALGDTLAAHSRQLLAAIPRLLNRRFLLLREEYKSSVIDAVAEETVEQWLQPGAWLEQFHREMQSLLLAELELRLQPIMGLIEALDVELGCNI